MWSRVFWGKLNYFPQGLQCFLVVVSDTVNSLHPEVSLHYPRIGFKLRR